MKSASPEAQAESRRQIEKAEGFISLGMLQEAWDTLESLPRSQKVTKEVLVLHLEILVKSEEWLKAAFLAESLCELDRKDADRHVQVGEFFLKSGDSLSALIWLQKHRQKCEHLAAFHFINAKAYAGIGKLDDAKNSLKAALEIDPGLRALAIDEPVLGPLWDL